MSDLTAKGSVSVRGQYWQRRETNAAHVTEIKRKTGCSARIADLLSARGIAPDQAADVLAPTLRNLLPDPSSLQDMDKAASLIWDAVEADANITVFADYDVDGGTSAAQLVRWARGIGAEFDIYVPDRVKEGYGPSIEAFENLSAAGTDLVITVDCGAAAHEPLHAASALELPIVVVDHHLMDANMPPAAALVNPNRPDDTSGLGDLAAAGVTFLLLVALNREGRRRGRNDLPDLTKLLDLTAMGTVCDVVSLKGINRAFVTQGLKVLSQRQNVGLTALGEVAGIDPPFGGYHIGYILGPRINAGGRIGQADMGARLLSTDDPEAARQYAEQLDTVNAERKRMQTQMYEEASQKAAKLPDDAPVIIVSMDGWHPGVIGIVAGRLKDQFDKPAIVIGVNDAGQGKGSGRSMRGVNLGAAIVAAKDKGLLSSGGGHAMAGGLSLEAKDIPEFTTFMSHYLRDDVEAARANLSLKYDNVVSAGALNQDLLSDIAAVAPYGAGNPQPIFVLERVRIAYAERLRGGHVRCSFEGSDGQRIGGIAFGADQSGLSEALLGPDTAFFDVAGRVKENVWKGRSRIDFHVVDLRACD